MHPSINGIFKIIPLTVNSIWGWYHPLTEKKIVKKRQMQSIWFFNSVIKISLDNFQNNFRNFISSGGLLPDHHWRGGKQEIYDFQGFWSIFQRVFDISL